MYNSYNDIKKEYEKIKQNDYLLYDENKARIYAENPILKNMDIEIVKLYASIATANVDGKDTKKIKERLCNIQEDRKKYLKEHNIVDDYKELKYVCNKCKDTGYVNGRKCSCFLQKEIELFDTISHFKNYIEEDNFNNIDFDFYNQSNLDMNGTTYKEYMEGLVYEFKNYIANMDKKSFSLLLVGATGTGKTFLARCMGAEAIKKNKSVLYVNVNEYLNSLKPDYDGEPLRYYAIACDLFILDDLGTERVTDYTNTELNYIIDKRLNDKKSTIITTNLVPDEIESLYLSSTYSRLIHAYDNQILAGEDLRRFKNANFK